MGTITVTGAIIIIIGWITLVEFDSYPEPEREQILQKIKSSPVYILLIALMPIGIIINILGGFFASSWMVMIGASLIILQGIIISFMLWNKKRWKGITLLAAVVILGIFVYLPLFIR